MTIGQPYWEPAAAEDEGEETEEEEASLGDTGQTDEEYENAFDSETGEADPQYGESEPGTKSRNCSTSGSSTAPLAMILFLLGFVTTRARET